jgi:hypothetical protein
LMVALSRMIYLAEKNLNHRRAENIGTSAVGKS